MWTEDEGRLAWDERTIESHVNGRSEVNRPSPCVHGQTDIAKQRRSNAMYYIEEQEIDIAEWLSTTE
jgi:hypothetical protein